MKIETDEIAREIIADKFGQPLIENNWRGEYVERLVLKALGSDFRHTSRDWGGWDIEHSSGLRIEVKQSAALQCWTAHGKFCRGRFDIAARTGRYEGYKWIAEEGRCAALYIFAWHGIIDATIADHRDPSQWLFYVVSEMRLPKQKTISQSAVERLSKSVRMEDLRSSVLRLLPA